MPKRLTQEEKDLRAKAKAEKAEAKAKDKVGKEAAKPKESKVGAAPVKPVNVEKKLPTFENLKVTKVLADGHTKTHFHCEMEGGQTMHVPKSKFN